VTLLIPRLRLVKIPRIDTNARHLIGRLTGIVVILGLEILLI